MKPRNFVSLAEQIRRRPNRRPLSEPYCPLGTASAARSDSESLGYFATFAGASSFGQEVTSRLCRLNSPLVEFGFRESA